MYVKLLARVKIFLMRHCYNKKKQLKQCLEVLDVVCMVSFQTKKGLFDKGKIGSRTFGKYSRVIIFLQKKVAEHSEKLLIADKRLAELEANMDTKRETENKEMVKQLKSAMKEEIAALKSKVRETYSTCYVCCSAVLNEIFI